MMAALLSLLIAALFIVSTANAACSPPFGQLSVVGTKINGNGKVVQLRGMSLFWSQWMGKFWNAQAVKCIKCTWNSNVVRAAMGVDSGGYLSDPSGQLALTTAVIDAAIKECIYVIVDFHTEQAPSQQTQATTFFTTIAKKYGNKTNIIYELYNEPNGPTWPTIKKYCEDLIGVIRKYDANNIIICGTPSWDQKVDEAANNMITGTKAKNVMYTLHYYANTHKQELRNTAQAAINKGLPIFITEYGCTNADAQSGLNAQECQNWWNFNNQNKLSYVNWAIEDKSEAAAALTPGSTAADVCNSAKFTEDGKLVNAHMKGLTGQGITGCSSGKR